MTLRVVGFPPDIRERLMVFQVRRFDANHIDPSSVAREMAQTAHAFGYVGIVVSVLGYE